MKYSLSSVILSLFEGRFTHLKWHLGKTVNGEEDRAHPSILSTQSAPEQSGRGSLDYPWHCTTVLASWATRLNSNPLFFHYSLSAIPAIFWHNIFPHLLSDSSEMPPNYYSGNRKGGGAVPGEQRAKTNRKSKKTPYFLSCPRNLCLQSVRWPWLKWDMGH